MEKNKKIVRSFNGLHFFVVSFIDLNILELSFSLSGMQILSTSKV